MAIFGAGGRMGATLAQEWRSLGSQSARVETFSRQELDITDFSMLENTLTRLAERGIRTIVNASGLTSLEAAEAQPELAWRVNAEAVGVMARRCAVLGLRLIHFSTDYVFDGKRREPREPYREEDATSPLSVYGRSKLAGEQAVLAVEAPHAVLRVAWVFGPGRPAFPDMVLRRALAGERVEAVADKWACPTSAIEVARRLWHHLDAAEQGLVGLFHVCNTGVCTWWDYARETVAVAVRSGWIDDPREELKVHRLKLAEMREFTAPRPIYTALDTTRFAQRTGGALSPWQEALAEYMQRQFPPAG